MNFTEACNEMMNGKDMSVDGEIFRLHKISTHLGENLVSERKELQQRHRYDRKWREAFTVDASIIFSNDWEEVGKD